MRDLTPLSPEELAEAHARLAGAPAEAVLAWAESRFGAAAAIASSFGVEDLVLIDLAVRHAPRMRVFALDTGRLPPEPYEVVEDVQPRYWARIESYFPDQPAGEALLRR